jgi:uncharacterized damage-inducible protein DinB
MGDTGGHYLDDVRQQFAAQRALAERAIAQLDEQQLFRSDGHDGNSVALLLQHVGGNLRSRWTDALTTDGEKPDRDRDAEFQLAEGTTIADLTARWHAGWRTLEDALAAFTPDDLLRTVTIRRQPLTLLQALQRSLAHTAQHVGQIVMLARRWKGADWQTLSIPRGRSAEYLRQPPA